MSNMSYEQPLDNKQNNEALSDTHPEDFDANGNPRSQRVFEDDGSVVMLSDEEYQDELERRRER